MKPLFPVLLLLALASEVGAQTDTSQPAPPPAPYLQTREVPSFKILMMDSATWFYKYQLPKNKPVVVVYFNPDCDHCQTETKLIMENMERFRNVQFVFVSAAPFAEIKKFYQEYGMAAHANIKMGFDPKYFIPSFYRVRYTPFVAVYNKEWKLNKVFEGGAKLDVLAKACEE
jgi:thiol-disulfide isomerase/thioredoxin